MIVRIVFGTLFFAPALFFAALTVMGPAEVKMNGLGPNPAFPVVFLCGLAAVFGAIGYAIVGWRSIGGIIPALIVAALIGVGVYNIAPTLHCWSYDTVALNDDGSYRCLNRDMGVP